jgi:hypothetical protein
MSAMPADADALPLLPGRDVVADGIDPPGHFMAGMAGTLVVQ